MGQALIVIYISCSLVILGAWVWKGTAADGGGSVHRFPCEYLRAWPALLLALLLAALVAWRLYQARSLALPAWVDSVHHALIVRKIMENGGIPWDLVLI